MNNTQHFDLRCFWLRKIERCTYLKRKHIVLVLRAATRKATASMSDRRHPCGLFLVLFLVESLAQCGDSGHGRARRVGAASATRASVLPPVCADNLQPNRIVLALYGTMHDLTAWADSHPGGRHLLERASNLDLPDATPLFESYHPRRDAAEMRARLAEFDTGVAAAYAPFYSFEPDGFYRDLRSRVSRILPKCHDRSADAEGDDCKKGGARSHLHFTCCLVLFFSLVLFASRSSASCRHARAVLYAFLAGMLLLRTCITEMHDASHHAVSNSITTNEFNADVASAFLLWDAPTWQAHHVLHHHIYTHSVTHDVDVTNSYPIVRRSAKHEWNGKPLAPGYVQILLWCSLPGQYLLQTGVYYLMARNARALQTGQAKRRIGEMRYEPHFGQSVRRRHLVDLMHGHEQAHLVFLRTHSSWQLAISSWLPAWLLLSLVASCRRTGQLSTAVRNTGLLFLAWSLGMNLAYGSTVFAQHDTEEAHASIHAALTTASAPYDWGEMQARSASDWGNEDSWLINFIFRGTNLGTLHHLFPSLHPDYLVEIMPVVRETMVDHGLLSNGSSYPTFPSMMPALLSSSRHLDNVRRQVSQEESIEPDGGAVDVFLEWLTAVATSTSWHVET